MRTTIKSVSAIEILDSRGNPTIETTVLLSDGTHAAAAVPSGASTGAHEAHELRDGGERMSGLGVRQAVENVNGDIAKALRSKPSSIEFVDRELIRLDGTPDKSNLGANAILSVSIAAAKANAASAGLPLFRYLGGAQATRLPVPMLNILNGGAHAQNSIDFQEFMIVPCGFAKFADGLFCAAEVYHALGSILKKENKHTGVGDEGGFAPDIDSTEAVLDYLCAAIENAGYTGGVKLALDVASSAWYQDGVYRLAKSGEAYTAEELIEKYEYLCAKYPIISIEDGLFEDDFNAWSAMTERLASKVMLVGDDLFVTNKERLKAGIQTKSANAVLIKPNQIGTLSETFETVRMAHDNGYKTVMSHRSGETTDTAIADLAVGLGCAFIKSGAPQRGERVCKYNRLIKIENAVGAKESAEAFGLRGIFRKI